jgi:hypothetical protein
MGQGVSFFSFDQPRIMISTASGLTPNVFARPSLASAMVSARTGSSKWRTYKGEIDGALGRRVLRCGIFISAMTASGLTGHHLLAKGGSQKGETQSIGLHQF